MKPNYCFKRALIVDVKHHVLAEILLDYRNVDFVIVCVKLHCFFFHLCKRFITCMITIVTNLFITIINWAKIYSSYIYYINNKTN